VQQAVAATVKEAVTSGVQQAIVEVLTNPELQQLLHPPKTPDPPVHSPTPTEASGGAGWHCGLWLAARGTVKRVAQAAGQAARVVGGWLAATARQTRELVVGGVQKIRRGACTLYAWVLSSRVAQVVGVGGLIAAACFVVNPALAGAVAGLAATVAAALAEVPAQVLSVPSGGS
jgi:hypothetical protein